MTIDKDTFAAARDRWLQKLNGRTFIEYANDLEEEDAKVAKKQYLGQL